MSNTPTKIIDLIHWVLDFSLSTQHASNHTQLTHPVTLAEKRQRAKKAFSTAHWKVTASGFVSGLMSTPITALPAATVNFAVTLKTHLTAAAEVALIYDPDFFERAETPWAKWELLVPVLNLDSNFFEQLDDFDGKITHHTVMKHLNKGTFHQFKKGILEHVALSVAKRGALTKTLPIVGSVVGSGFNLVKLKQTQKRVIDYFENRD